MSLYERLSPKSKIICNVLTLPWVGITFYWLFTYTGPAKTISDFQAEYLLDGKYYGAITVLSLLLPVVFLVLGICFLIDYLTKSGIFEVKDNNV